MRHRVIRKTAAFLSYPLLLHLVSVASAQDGAASLALPNMELATLTNADGSKAFRFVTSWPLKYVKKGNDPEPVLAQLLAGEMGRKNWCPNGYTEIKRTIAMKMIVIEGTCKP